MSTVEDLPADLRAKVGRAVAPTHGPTGRAFIGSATNEYQGKKPGQVVGDPAAPPATDYTPPENPQPDGTPCARWRASTRTG